MNIVPTTANASPNASSPSDGPTTGPVAPDAGNGVDGTTGRTTPTQGFGSMLSRHLDDARSGPTQPGRVGPDARVQAADAGPDDSGDATAIAVDAAGGTGAVAAQDLFPALTAATTAGSDKVGSGSIKGRADDDRTHDGDAGSDLAAQLALASQWTSAAKPVDATVPSSKTAVDTAVAATTVAGTARESFDAKSLSTRDRATQGKDDAANGRGLSATADAGKAAASNAASGDASGTDARQRDERGTPLDTPLATTTKDDDPKTRSDLALAALDAASPAGAGTTTHADTTANGDAFALRLAAHVSGTAPINGTGAAAASTATTAPTAFAFVQEPVGSNAWSHEVGQATLRMAANDLQSASIRLNPEHLGPLDVQVRVDNGVAHLAFNATHVDTRQALEASRGTLDQLFTNQGLKMGDVSVGSGSNPGSNDASASRGGQTADPSRRDGGGRWSGNDAGADSDAPITTVTTRITRALGLVDTFA